MAALETLPRQFFTPTERCGGSAGSETEPISGTPVVNQAVQRQLPPGAGQP